MTVTSRKPAAVAADAADATDAPGRRRQAEQPGEQQAEGEQKARRPTADSFMMAPDHGVRRRTSCRASVALVSRRGEESEGFLGAPGVSARSR
jgi:hypothetical protein